MAETARCYEEGNFDCIVAELNETDGTYGTVYKLQGLVNFDGTFAQTTEKKAADDVTDYVVKKSPLTCSGTITFIGLSKADYKALYANVTDGAEALVFGRKGKTRKLGLSFKNTRVAGDTTSINKYTFNSVVLDLPPLSTKTLEEGNTDTREFAIPFTASPYQYTSADGEKDTVTMSILNSVDDATTYNANKDKIYIPAQDNLS